LCVFFEIINQKKGEFMLRKKKKKPKCRYFLCLLEKKTRASNSLRRVPVFEPPIWQHTPAHVDTHARQKKKANNNYNNNNNNNNT